MTIAESARALAHRRHAVGIEDDRREVPDLVDLAGQPVLGRNPIAGLAQFGRHGGQGLVVRVAHVNGKEHVARDGVARVGAGLQHADRGHRLRRPRGGDALHLDHHARRAHQRVLAPVHGRCAGVGFGASHRDFEPALALGAGDHADRLFLGLEDRPLLDMRLEVGLDRAPAAFRFALVADARQLRAEGVAIRVLAAVGPVQVEDTREDARGDHGRGEAGALFVGPDHRLDRCLGLDAVVVEGSDHLEPGEHAVDAVELAAGRLGVQVRAGHDRRQRRVAARAAREDIAHGIHGHGAAGGLAPAHEEIATLPV